MLCDNINANHLTANLAVLSTMKHIDIDFHFVCDLLVDGKLDVAMCNLKIS